MHTKVVISSRVVKKTPALPTIYRFDIPVDQSLPHAKWGWHSVSEISAVCRHLYLVGGCPNYREGLTHFASFFPVASPSGKMPVFSWVIERENGQYIFEQGDIAFCPFPNISVQGVCRTCVGVNDSLYVPSNWGALILDLVESGAVELVCDTKSGPSDPRNHFNGMYYSMVTWKKERVTLSRDTIKSLAPGFPEEI